MAFLVGCRFFPVPKGLSDVRMVYNGTSNGLNDCLWAPWFPLPTVDAVERSLVPGTCLGDMDVGEMFLNFPLHEDMQKFTGVDLRLFKKYFSDPLAHPDIVCWGRACMGTKPSPYISVRFLLCSLETIKRIKEPHAADNLFRWDEVILNLPGMTKFDSTFPWVYKWDKSRRCVGADIQSYINDLRLAGWGEEFLQRLIRYVSSQLQWLGIQDAARKRTGPHYGTLPWAGTISSTDSGKVCRTVSQERWDKAGGLVQDTIKALGVPEAACQRLWSKLQSRTGGRT